MSCVVFMLHKSIAQSSLFIWKNHLQIQTGLLSDFPALVDRWWNIDALISDSSATGWTGTFGTWELFLQRPSAMGNVPLVSFQTQICSNLCLSLNQRPGNVIYNLNAPLLLCKDWLIS